MFLARHTPGTHLSRRIQFWILASTLLLAIGNWLPASAQTSSPDTNVLPPVQLHMPMVVGGVATLGACPAVSSNSYTSTPILGESRDPDRPPLLDPDLNLANRGYTVTIGLLGLTAINGPTDDDAPQLAHLFRPARVPDFPAIYQVYDWDWNCRVGGCVGSPISVPEATLVEMVTTPSEPLYPPRRNATIGGDHIALVLFAEQFRLTFTYTREDTPAVGYLVHVENFCVDPNLLALYQELHQAGRASLPGLRLDDSIGSALGESVLIAVRDTGSFMDPRSGKDWWQDTVRAMLAAQAAGGQ
jgi:hypothetical protein